MRNIFPKNQHKNRFQLSWLAQFSWLVYSKILDGAFCLYCVLFGSQTSEHNSGKLKKFFKEPFTNWKQALRFFKEHQTKSPVHRLSVERQLAFRKVLVNKSQKPINLSDGLRERIDENRKKLKIILQTVLFCARQYVPLRGHRDDSKYLSCRQ